MDAAEHVIKSKAEIRQVLLDYAEVGGAGLFGSGRPVRVGDSKQLYEGLGQDGSAMVMNIEMMQGGESLLGCGNNNNNNNQNLNGNPSNAVSKVKKKANTATKKGTTTSKKKA